MFRRIIPVAIISVLIFSSIQMNFQDSSITDFAHSMQFKEVFNNISDSSSPNMVNIGEVYAARGGFGFIDHELNIRDVKVKWVSENGKVNGTIEMNYSFYYLFEKKFPAFMSAGFSVYLDGEKLGENKIFRIEKGKKAYMGKLPINISFTSDKKYIVIYAKAWFSCFPPNIFDLLYHNLTNHGLLDWFTLGMFDIKRVKIEIEIEKKKTLNENSSWIHTRYDSQNTGFTPAKGKGSISHYKMKILTKYLIGMGTGEPKVADIDKDGRSEIIFGTQTGYAYAVENGWKVDWKCKLNAPTTYMAPEMGDLDGDGDYEIIMSSDNIMETSTSGLRVIDREGNLMAEWLNPEGGFPLGDPRAADIDGDGKDEILVGLLGDDKRGNDLYALSYENGNLEVIWKYQAYSWVQWPSAVADINNDGEPEIIFTSVDMSIYCLDADGNLIWNYVTKGGIQPIYPGGFKRILFHPVVYDINNDGYDEIITTTCLYDKPNWSGVYCIGHNGNLIWKFDLQCGVWGPAAVGDINRDGKPEIVFGDIEGTIYVIEDDGVLLWEYSLPKIFFRNGLSGNPDVVAIWPYLADLDGNGYSEIIAVAWCHGIFIFSYDGILLKQWPRPLGVTGFGGSAIADIDKDGDLEIIFGVAGKAGILGKLGIIDQ